MFTLAEHNRSLCERHWRIYFDIKVHILLGNEGVAERFGGLDDCVAVDHRINHVCCILRSHLDSDVTAAHCGSDCAAYIGIIKRRNVDVVNRCLVVECRDTVHYILVAAGHKSPRFHIVGCGETDIVAFADIRFFDTAVDVHFESVTLHSTPGGDW